MRATDRPTTGMAGTEDRGWGGKLCNAVILFGVAWYRIVSRTVPDTPIIRGGRFRERIQGTSNVQTDRVT